EAAPAPAPEMQMDVEGLSSLVTSNSDLRYCHMLWMGSWSGCDVLGVGLVGSVPFLSLAVDEFGSGSVEGLPVGCGDASTPWRVGVAEIVGHGEGGGSAAGFLGGLGSEPDGGEGRFDGVGAPQMLPVLGGEVVERQ